MKPVRLAGELLLGHKGAAVEVPFDPAERWEIPPSALWRGRRGHRVSGTLKRVRFQSFVVARSKRFWLLVDEELMASAGVAIGDRIELTVEPIRPAASAPRRASRSLPPARPRRGSRSTTGSRRGP